MRKAVNRLVWYEFEAYMRPYSQLQYTDGLADKELANFTEVENLPSTVLYTKV